MMRGRQTVTEAVAPKMGNACSESSHRIEYFGLNDFWCVRTDALRFYEMLQRAGMGQASSTFRVDLKIAAPLLLFAVVQSAPASELVRQGQDVALRLCAACHGIDRAERSPIAAAPAFRRMASRIDLDRMAERLQSGIVVGHPEMPAFVLKEHEAFALVAYIKSLQAN